MSLSLIIITTIPLHYPENKTKKKIIKLKNPFTMHIKGKFKNKKIKKKKQNPYKSTKPIPVWTDWYPKNNPNPSKFQNLNIGEITNQTIKMKSEQTATFGCVGSGSERRGGGYSGGEELRWSEERRCWCWCCFLQVRASELGDFGFIWATILCDRVYWGLIE